MLQQQQQMLKINYPKKDATRIQAREVQFEMKEVSAAIQLILQSPQCA